MKDLVSNRWIRVATLVTVATSMWLVCSTFIPYGFPWTGLVWVSLAFAAAFWMGRPDRSIANMIDDVEAEPLRARMAPPAPKAVL